MLCATRTTLPPVEAEIASIARRQLGLEALDGSEPRAQVRREDRDLRRRPRGCAPACGSSRGWRDSRAPSRWPAAPRARRGGRDAGRSAPRAGARGSARAGRAIRAAPSPAVAATPRWCSAARGERCSQAIVNAVPTRTSRAREQAGAHEEHDAGHPEAEALRQPRADHGVEAELQDLLQQCDAREHGARSIPAARAGPHAKIRATSRLVSPSAERACCFTPQRSSLARSCCSSSSPSSPSRSCRGSAAPRSSGRYAWCSSSWCCCWATRTPTGSTSRIAGRRQSWIHMCAAGREPRVPAGRGRCRLEARGRRQPGGAHPRAAFRYGRPALLPAFVHEPAGAGVVRPRVPGLEPVPALRAVQLRLDAGAARLPVPVRAVVLEPAAVDVVVRGICARSSCSAPGSPGRAARCRPWTWPAASSSATADEAPPRVGAIVLWLALSAMGSVVLLGGLQPPHAEHLVDAAAVGDPARRSTCSPSSSASRAGTGTAATSTWRASRGCSA